MAGAASKDPIDDVLDPTSSTAGGSKSPKKASAKDRAGGATKASAQPTRGQPHMALRIALGTAGLLLLVGFFLPWLKLEEVATVSGMQLVIDNNPIIRALVGDDVQRWMLLLVPGFGLALTAVGFLGIRYSGHISAVLGLLIVLYGVITMIIFFFQKTGVGLWLIVIGALLAVGAGAFAWARSRGEAAAAPKKKKPALDEL